MRSPFRARPWVIAIALLATSRVSSAHDSPFAAPEGQALLVFVQNQRADREMLFTVFDSDKRCVVRVGGREAAVLPLAPVRHVLYVLGYNKTRRIELYPEVGRTYFTRLLTVEKPMARVPEVMVARRATESHKDLKSWLKGAFVTHARDDARCYGEPLQERGRRTDRRILEADSEWKHADPSVRADYTVVATDGLTPSDLDRL